MLGERYCLNLEINNEIRELSFDFRFLKNLYSLLKQSGNKTNPIRFIDDFIKAEDRESYYIDILYCMLNGEINLIDLQEIIEQIKDVLFPVLYALIITEWRIENIFEDDEEKGDSEVEDEETELDDDYEKEFLRFWNNNYYNAMYQLHMSEEEFLNSSPRKLGTLNRLNMDYYKNIILQRDIAIQKAKNDVNDGNIGNKKIEKCERLRDLF